MKAFGLLVFCFGFLVACGDSKKEAQEEQLTFENEQQKLSYCLGAEQAKMITQSGDPNLDQLNFEAIAKGFGMGLNDKDQFSDGCRETLTQLYGPYGQDLDTSVIDEGSECIGRISGSVFYTNWNKKQMIDRIDMTYVKHGFNHGLKGKDTLVPQMDRQIMVNNLILGLNEDFGNRMLAQAKELPNTRELQGGLIIQTLEEGKGGSPKASDDVQCDYVLTNAYGDTIESSFEYKAQRGESIPAFNLNGVITGWSMAFPEMKKGGKYRIFVPYDLAYGAERGMESLCFYIELNDFGPAGSLVK